MGRAEFNGLTTENTEKAEGTESARILADGFPGDLSFFSVCFVVSFGSDVRIAGWLLARGD